MIFLACLWLFITGLGIAHWCMPSARFTEKAGLAFPVSAGLHGAVLFLLMQSFLPSVWLTVLLFAPFLLPLRGLRFNQATAPLPGEDPLNCAGSTSISSAGHRPDGGPTTHPSGRAGWTVAELIAILFVLFTAVQILVHVFFVPAIEWDAVAQWFLKGKALTVDGKITADFTNWLQAQGLHPDYPWNVPLMYAWLSRAAGRFSEPACEAVVYAFYISLVLILYSLARLRFRRPAALLALAIYLAIPGAVEHVLYRDADTILETYFAAVLFLVLRHQLVPAAKTVPLVAALVFLACWTKREGLVYCALLLVPWLAWLSLKRGTRGRLLLPAAAAIGSVLGIFAFWLPKTAFGVSTMFVPGPAAFQGISGEVHKLGTILYLMAKECLKVYRWNFTWLLPPFLLWFGRDRYGLRILFLAHLLVYFFVYFLAPVDFRWHISTSWSRLLLHALPELYAWTIFVAAENLTARQPED